MAGRGIAPKENRARARDNHEFARVDSEPAECPRRELPEDLLPANEIWHPATLRWWNTWARSPLTADLPDVDWCELEACAVLHHEYMRKRTFTLASELRLRMAKFGATPEDRMRLRVQITTVGDEPGQGPSSGSAAARRRNLHIAG